MKFARYTFAGAGIYGILILLPHYFLFDKVGTDNPPAITHPEYFYGFVGVALAFQLVFLVIASDPVRYRPIIPAAIFEKFSFGIPTMILLLEGRVGGPIVLGAAFDLVLGVLFIAAYFKLLREPAATK
jgi:hypothetical protein